MSLALNMRRALSRNTDATAANEPRQYAYTDSDNSKARHILGLDVAHTRSSRKNSMSSTSTNKLRSVTFSDATTAAVTNADIVQSGKEVQPALSRKSSSPFMRRNKKSELPGDTIKPRISTSSLRSFYDKSRTPLNVSQQTSESSSRDFALRKGAPVVVSTATQETEHSRQLRLRKSHQSLPQDKDESAHSINKMSASSSKSLNPSLVETISDTIESLPSQLSASRISILRPAEDARPTTPPQRSVQPEHPFAMVKPIIDPARAKINVRRPKAGTKNWFDSLDTDSSEGEGTPREPQLAAEVALGVTGAIQKAKICRIPPRSPPKDVAAAQQTISAPVALEQYKTQQRADSVASVTPQTSHRNLNRKRKANAFDNVDLTKQSVLYLDSSDDDEMEEEPCQGPRNTSVRGSLRSSVMSGPWDNAQVETSRARTVSTEDSEKLLQRLQLQRLTRPGGRTITYLEDCSTETVTQQEDLLTSFPQTPTDTHSLGASLRDSILSEDEGSTSTKFMSVTRQEENLIAAMRLKKSTMKRAQAMVHRQGALDSLERDSTSSPTRPVQHGRTRSLDNKTAHETPGRPRRVRSPTSIPQRSRRTDSVTTFQTESVLPPSVRSSVTSPLSEDSGDVHLSYPTADGPDPGLSRSPQIAKAQLDKPQSIRDTFLSELSASTYSEGPPSVRNSHIVELDTLDRQMLRDEIPSQLFMERPFIGWEVQTGAQQAH